MDQLTSQAELSLDDSIPELLDYYVKVSARSRNVHLRVLPITGLEITIPRRFSRKHIPELIQANRSWIEKQLAYVREHTNPEFLEWPPTSLHLRSHSRTVDGVRLQIRYNRQSQPNALVNGGMSGKISGDILDISGTTTDRALLLRLLSKVLKQEAKRVFEPQLAGYATEFGLDYSRLTIRGQKTLWGSYSSSGTLSLNFKLLFLPSNLARYVLLHELAHTRYLNHSATFWRFLRTMEPDALELDRALNHAGDFVPPWLESVT